MERAPQHDHPRRAQYACLRYVGAVIGILALRYPGKRGPCMSDAEMEALERRYHAGDTAAEFAQRIIDHRERNAQ